MTPADEGDDALTRFQRQLAILSASRRSGAQPAQDAFRSSEAGHTQSSGSSPRPFQMQLRELPIYQLEEASEGNLPYGGSLQEAIAAQDRDAIRMLLLRQNSSKPLSPAPRPGTPPELSTELAADEFACPICQELLHKPIVNACGHTFCFWCLHRAMSGFGTSSCPLCRASFRHFGAPCEALVHYMARRFPSEVAARSVQVAEEERTSMLAGSIDVPPPDAESMHADAARAFCCVGCALLAPAPRVLNCGHLVCGACIPSLETCPACAAALVCVPKPAHLLAAILERECAEEAAAARLREERAVPLQQPDETSTHNGAASSDVVPPMLANPFSHRQSSWVEDATSDVQADDYVHHGVGCDGCGVYPVVGRCFRCLDCPEQIGYDLCAACHACNRITSGRFGQVHTAEHRMRERPQQKDLLHRLKEMHPELDEHQLFSLLYMNIGAEESGE